MASQQNPPAHSFTASRLQTFVGKSEVLMELEGMGPGPAGLFK